ncbi:hypothetical protein [Oceanobacillus sp. 1P07AA]|uniref:hypothetical protein n=1 Tax=Oceanobacillus sp. 1P07AA TaxID=3132293 RepID=UPI0039A5DD38
MKQLFMVITLIFILTFIYILLKQETKWVKISVFMYFLLLSIVFMSGLFYILSAYNLNDNPVEGGFNKQFNWVYYFLHLFFIPLFILIGYKLFKFTNNTFNKIWIKIAMYIFWIALLLGVGYVSSFIFILVFYGFAP